MDVENCFCKWQKLNVSSAFLSGVGNGKRKIPSDWVNRIAAIYGLSGGEKTRFARCLFDANNAVEIGLTDLAA